MATKNSSTIAAKRPIPMQDRRFSRWLVIQKSEVNLWDKGIYWECLCDCGTRRIVLGTFLRNGRSRSCGCLQREAASVAVKSHATKHGLSDSPEYSVWHGMHARCKNPNNDSWARYGGRGIAVSEPWNAFDNFYRDMGPRPSAAHSIERLDNDKGYSPSNCVWALPTTQARNRRRNAVYEFDGKSLCLSEWAERLNTPRHLLSNRLKRGWSVKDAFTLPRKWGAHTST